MAYVIAEPCIGTKDTACVDVCPVDCIHPRGMYRLWRLRPGLSSDGNLCFGRFAGEVGSLYTHQC